MKLLTFDMGTDSARLQERLEALGKIIQSKRPEFVALQNVSNETIKRINGFPWCTLYKAIHPPYKFETRSKPTVALFAIYPAEDSAVMSYHETSTNRILQKGYYLMYDKQKEAHVITVCTTTLEAGLKFSATREKQLNEAFLSLADDEDAFILGDFCLDDDIDGDLALEGGWKDAWLSVPGNTSSNGYTYDPDKNPLIKEDPHGPGRPDRIFFKTRRYKLDSIEVVGREPYTPARGSAVTVSTHYGLFAQFTPTDQLLPSNESKLVSVVFNRTQWSLQFQEQQTNGTK